MGKTKNAAEFKAGRVSRSYILKINSASENVFPLLCPRREMDWLDGWNYQMVFSQSGYAEEGCIFKTKHEISTETIWTITRHEKDNNRIEILRVTPGIVHVHMIFLLNDKEDGTTDLNIEYIFTALSKKGNEFIEEKSAAVQFIHMVQWWEKALNYYLESGNKLLALKLSKVKPETEKNTESKKNK